MVIRTCKNCLTSYSARPCKNLKFCSLKCYWIAKKGTPLKVSFVGKGKDGSFYGKKHTEETKEKMSEAQKKRFQSEPVWNKGLHIYTGGKRFVKGNSPPVHKDDCRCFRCDRKNWVVSKETINKIRKSNLGQKHPTIQGENNHNWMGDDVGYTALHDWVKRNLGKAFWCTFCFSMVNVQWANISHEYKRDLTDWIQLCVKCHKRYDLGGEWTITAKDIFLPRSDYLGYGQRRIKYG